MKYISEIITKREISKWEFGERVLISSQTGTGKSQWVKDVLYEYANNRNQKILLLSNRTALKNQNSRDIAGKEDTIETANYQALERFGDDVDEVFSDYQYVVMDECHYFQMDSKINKKTETFLSKIKEPYRKSVLILISATPEPLLHYHTYYEHRYDFERDYSFIENVYVYDGEEMLKKIIMDVPMGEKIAFFGNVEDAFSVYQSSFDSTFVCSESQDNAYFRKHSNKKTLEEILETGTFSARVLAATKVLDNGVSLSDLNLKTIIIDTVNPVDFIQFLGRKRILGSNDRINLYIAEKKKNTMFPLLNEYKRRLQAIDSRIEYDDAMEYLEAHKDSDLDYAIRNNGEINNAAASYAKYAVKVMGRMFNADGNGHLKEIERILYSGVPPRNPMKKLERIIESKSLKALLERYSGIRMTGDEEKTKFKIEFFKYIFEPKKKYDPKKIRPVTINSLMESHKVKYQIEVRDDGSGRKYWIVVPQE